MLDDKNKWSLVLQIGGTTVLNLSSNEEQQIADEFNPAIATLALEYAQAAVNVRRKFWSASDSVALRGILN